MFERMIEIAGGIILAVLFFAFLPAILALGISFGVFFIGIALLVGAFFLVLKVVGEQNLSQQNIMALIGITILVYGSWGVIKFFRDSYNDGSLRKKMFNACLIFFSVLLFFVAGGLALYVQLTYQTIFSAISSISIFAIGCWASIRIDKKRNI